jgi:agmatine deiminase
MTSLRKPPTAEQLPIRIPADWEPHVCCWMAWAVHKEWENWIGTIKDELATIIETIARFEPIKLLTPRSELAEAQSRFSGGNIEIVEAPVDDIWMRDIAPTFALQNSEAVVIDWNFNGWGNSRERPSRPGDRLAQSKAFGVSRITSSIVAEGGAFITDGEGTLIATRSCLLNTNRNSAHKGVAQERIIEREFARFGIVRTIWLEGEPDEPITNGHVDGFAMFTAPGHLLIETAGTGPEQRCSRERDIALLRRSLDAAGRKLKVDRVFGPRQRYWRFRGPLWSPCYLNAYIANGAVITACFGDRERDEIAKEALAQVFPDREIIMLRIDHIANGGGGIRCLTQPMAKIF